MEVPIEQQAPTQVVVGDSGMTPEQQEEMKLRMKYPNPQKPGGSTFIQKMLHRGNKKYFDSGDYNMAKSRTKAALQHNNNTPGLATTTTSNTTVPSNNNNGQVMLTPAVSVDDPSYSSLNNSNTPTVMDTSGTSSNSTPASTTVGNLSSSIHPSSIATPSTNNNNELTAHIHQQVGNVTPSVQAIKRHQSQEHAHSPPPTVVLLPNPSSPSQLSSSISSSSIGANPTGATMISSSMSSEKIALNSFDQANTDLLLLDSDEIGHGIPTPECLPQSRKHSMTQSKLAATPTHLSSTSSN